MVDHWREALAGALAGAFSRTAVAPLDRLKLLKQLQAEYAQNRSAWQVATEVYRREGMLSFWRGNLPLVLRTSGTAAVNFTCLNFYKKAVVGPLLGRTGVRQRRRQFMTSLMAGGLAGGTSTTILYPLEFLRTRLSMDLGTNETRKYRGMLDVMRTILRTDGILGVYQGYGIALAGGVFYRVLYLGGYDAVKNDVLTRREAQLEGSEEEATLGWGERLAMAQTISLVAGTLSYPLDTVRRLMMMQAGLSNEERKYRNSFQCVRTVWTKQGIRGFFLGIGPNLVRSVGGALLLVAYDSFRSML